MHQLLRDLASLSGLRDRATMEVSLVGLVLRNTLWSVRVVRLVRAVGEPYDQRWLVLAALERGSDVVQRDRFWWDTSALPALSDYPLRERAQVTETLATQAGQPCLSCFPLDTQASVTTLLEVESDQPLSASACALIDSVGLVFGNLQGLLDYGERDTLTDLLNRKTFDAAFLRASQVAMDAEPASGERRQGPPLAGGYWLAVLDIDHFKHVNDGYGHLIGDEVLLLMARLMKHCFRYHDQLYRFGGEEFVVLMRCANEADALAALERFRQRVADHAFPQVGHITVSIGVAELRPNDTPSAAFDRADQAVYYAKGHGRNQLCCHRVLVASGALTDVALTETDFDIF